MTAPIYGVMEYLNGPIVEWRIMCPIHGLVITRVPQAAHLIAAHQNHLPEIVTENTVSGELQ